MANGLPPGFTLDPLPAEPPASRGLPPGFRLDDASTAPPASDLPQGFQLDTPALPHPEIDPKEGGYPQVNEDPKQSHWAVTRGLVSGLMEQNPQMMSEGLEGLSHLAPDALKGSLLTGSATLRDVARSPEGFKRLSGSMWDVDSLSGALTWAGETLGSGLASTAPSLVMGGLGAAAGSPLGPVGSTIGGLAGMTTPSALMNYGEVYKALKDAQLDPALAAKYAAAAAVPITALDVGSMVSIVGRFGGVEQAKKEVIRNFAQRIARQVYGGGKTEGITEALQGAIKDLTVLGTTDKPFSAKEFAKERVEDFVGGAITGGAMSAPAGIRSEINTSAPTPEEIRNAMTGTPQTPTPNDVESAINPPAAPTPTPTPAAGTSDIETLFASAPIETAPAEPSTKSPTEPEILPPEPVIRDLPNDVPSNVVDFLARNSTPLQEDNKPPEGSRAAGTNPRALGTNPRATKTNPRAIAFTSRGEVDPTSLGPNETSNAPQKDEITGQPGANLGRLTALLGENLYGSPENMGSVTIKELMQNSYDAIKDLIGKGTLKKGQIHFVTDTKARTISIYDNGSGMAPEVLANQFLQIAGTKKDSNRASGGLGIAKMLVLFANKQLDVRTMQNGKVARLLTTGQDLKDAMTDPSKKPKIQVSEPTAAERAMFKDGHGTAIKVTIPEGFTDSSTGEHKKIDFPDSHYGSDVLSYSPLFDDIDVSFNGVKFDGRGAPGIGSGFPKDNFTQLFNVKFHWGTARVYVSKEPEAKSWEQKAHVLSNGLWQFSTNIKKDARNPYGPNLPYRFYVDVAASSKPEEPGYPFTLDRQSFTKQAKQDFGQLFLHISNLYAHEDLAQGASDFGSIHYLGIGSDGKLAKTPKEKIEPKAPRTATPVTSIKRGDKIDVVDGKLLVNGREIPTLKPEDMKGGVPSSDELRVDQNTINPHAVMVHDNVMVHISDVEKKSLVQLGEEKFGKRFDEFLHSLGQSFMILRDTVARVMEGDPAFKDYKELRREAIGISFDIEYRGVSIKLPFAGMFINPAVPEYSDPLRAAVGMVGTMIHELAHHQVRSHNAEFPAEMQRILINLYVDPKFDFFQHMQGVVKNVAQNKDIFDFINGIFSGTYVLKPRGNRFQDPSRYEARDGGTSGAVAPSGSGRVGGQSVSGKLGFGSSTSTKGADGGSAGLRTSRERTVEAVLEYYTARNRAALNDANAPYAQAESIPLRQMGESLFQAVGGVPPTVQQAFAHTDEIGKRFKYAYGLDRLADRFSHITPLLRYAEADTEMRVDIMKISNKAVGIAKKWRRLGKHAEGLAALIDDVANMNYLTLDERNRNIARHPTLAEFNALVTKHKVTSEALQLFNEQKKFMEVFLTLSAENATEHAKRTIKDPIKQMNKIDEIRTQQAALLSRPYFPFVNFGKYVVKILDKNNKVVYLETVERKGAVPGERIQKALAAKLEKTLPPGHRVETGILRENTEIFSGLPPTLLNSIRDELTLSPAQQAALDDLMYRHSPAASFAKKFRQNSYVPGYSHDFMRSFSRFAFSGARYYARTKYAWRLRDEIKNTRKVGGNQADSIANYLDDHLENNVLNSKGDYGLIKGGIFLMTFGWSVAGATLNMSQVPMITLPFLGAKFGDAKALAALAKAIPNVKNFYKKDGYKTATQFEMRALEYGIQSGRISESQAAELAGLAQGNNLLGMGNSKPALFMQDVLEKSAWFFEMAEQFNRRVTYRAALDLAMKNPNALGVREARIKYEDEYTKLVTGGSGFGAMPFTPHEASAIIAAIHATEQTQFVYARSTRPRMFRGRLAGTIFVFKTYLVNVLELMAQNKSSVLPRFIVMSLLAGGLMGLPGADDLADISNILGKWLFGKDFNVRRALREFLVEAVSDKADVVLHGLARRGFGLPALLDMIGENPSRGLGSIKRDAAGRPIIDPSTGRPAYNSNNNVPAPVLDRSASIGMGRILPFDLGKVVDPGKDVDKAIADTAQRTSGAAFSVGFNIYKFLQDISTHENAYKDFKTYEKIMPRALSSATSAYRAYSEGRERSKGGVASAATVVNYDVRDTEQMMEVIARGLGYMPLRQSARWDEIIMEQEAKSKLQFEQKLLYEQWFEAKMGGRQEELDRMRKATIEYNKQLPEWARGYKVTGESVQKAIEARMIDKVHKEAGVPRQARDVPVAKHIQSLFPESVVDVRKIK